MDFSSKFATGQLYHDFLNQFGTDEHRRRWEQCYAAIQLSDSQKALLAGFKRQMPVLCFAGAWCGDCVEQCPILQRFAEATLTIELRFFDRDAHPDLGAALRICGGARVPVVVFLNEEGQFVGLYGDRTLSKYRHMAATQLGAACPTGLVPPATELRQAVTQDWLNEFERVQLLLRTSPRLRQKHND